MPFPRLRLEKEAPSEQQQLHQRHSRESLESRRSLFWILSFRGNDLLKAGNLYPDRVIPPEEAASWVRISILRYFIQSL